MLTLTETEAQRTLLVSRSFQLLCEGTLRCLSSFSWSPGDIRCPRLLRRPASSHRGCYCPSAPGAAPVPPSLGLLGASQNLLSLVFLLLTFGQQKGPIRRLRSVVPLWRHNQDGEQKPSDVLMVPLVEPPGFQLTAMFETNRNQTSKQASSSACYQRVEDVSRPLQKEKLLERTADRFRLMRPEEP